METQTKVYKDVNGDIWKGEWRGRLFYCSNWSSVSNESCTFDRIPSDWKEV